MGATRSGCAWCVCTYFYPRCRHKKRLISPRPHLKPGKSLARFVPLHSHIIVAVSSLHFTDKRESMGSGNGAPSWADQWGNSGGLYDDSDDETKARGSAKKTGNMKAVASASLDKAKAAATVGAQKVKSGTSMGIKWVKTRCQKRTSK